MHSISHSGFVIPYQFDIARIAVDHVPREDATILVRGYTQ
jgi:hypothetical protein